MKTFDLLVFFLLWFGVPIVYSYWVWKGIIP